MSCDTPFLCPATGHRHPLPAESDPVSGVIREYIDAMDDLDRITIEPGKMGGQPCIRGHRFTVEQLLSLVGSGWSLGQIQEDFPFIEAADLQQAVAYASFSVREFHLPITRSA